jgi:hypothetical protein
VKGPNLLGKGRHKPDPIGHNPVGPGIPGAKSIHGAIAHPLHRFGRGHRQEVNVLIRIYSPGGKPVTDPKILIDVGEGMSGLEFASVAGAEIFEIFDVIRGSRDIQPQALASMHSGNGNPVALGDQLTQNCHAHRPIVGDGANVDQVRHRHLPLATVDSPSR